MRKMRKGGREREIKKNRINIVMRVKRKGVGEREREREGGTV